MTDEEIRQALRLMRWEATRAKAPPRIWDLIANSEALLKHRRPQIDKRAEIERKIKKFLKERG